ncbi:MAG: glutamine synthetase [Actinomycetota bacterium]|nr:glutamine synthetase [Actinomycetota bacterium]
MTEQDSTPAPPMPVQRLHDLIENGHVDTVLVVFTDMQGRLVGKRLHGRHFVDHVLSSGTEVPGHLLSVDVDMNPAPGYTLASWDKGHGNVLLRPDLNTMRAAPWLPASVIVQADPQWPTGEPVQESPRQILAVQAARAADLGYAALGSSSLEFMVFEEDYNQAWDTQYSSLTPTNRYSTDHSVIGTSRVEPLLRDLRNAMYAAGLSVQCARGERNRGQHELVFAYTDLLTAADHHAIYKTAAKEIAARHEKSLTFMAKVDDGPGNGGHLQMSLRGTDGTLSFVNDDEIEGPTRNDVFRSFVAGILTTMREFSLFYAPNVNSYKRFRAESFAPTAIAWGEDNRSCALRIVGEGESLRVENRVPGADANPYLAMAAMLAGGLFGLRTGLPLEAPLVGNAYAAQRQRVPGTLREARDLFAGSVLARDSFGDDVVDHYVHAADVELDAFEAAVTDWELRRGFERL